jgi:hypothetical protein
VAAILKQRELSLHEAAAQVAKEHNVKLNTVRRAHSSAQVSKERAHGNRRADNPGHYKALIDARVAKHSHILPPKSGIQTFLPFVAASGRVWMVVYVFQKAAPKNNRRNRTFAQNMSFFYPIPQTSVVLFYGVVLKRVAIYYMLQLTS